MKTKDEISWASEEFADVDLGDKRLNIRLMRIYDSFSESPESPINQACADWAGSKAAYRFFQNDKVEECRLAHADRLTRYLTIMSIVAWRLFMITLIARTDPTKPCTEYLAEFEWKVLYLKVNKNKELPEETPTIGEVVVWIARLGGFLARKGDGSYFYAPAQAYLIQV